MKYIITNKIGHKVVTRDFIEAEQANNYIHNVCEHNSFTTATVTELTNNKTHITIWDTLY